ncbi:hypothetical protein OIE67_42690 [Nonomuraea fuscirosea]|uniref:hypothetical protein n=1 Tax=Nonomuraea fuscirosea TaxID=1291556 RepID=UPI002DD7E4BE|nr:hypothetical protein [Nonomuraea fuscirosea]WSA50711.1 hypothetical protein OIE67_42690 [Nonomuraea fuscirosea]
MRIDNQHNRTADTLHGLQPCDALSDLLGPDSAADKNPGITRPIDHRGSHTGKKLPALTEHRPAPIKPENRQPLNRLRRDDNQHRHGTIEITSIRARNIDRHPASIPPPCLQPDPLRSRHRWVRVIRAHVVLNVARADWVEVTERLSRLATTPRADAESVLETTTERFSCR